MPQHIDQDQKITMQEMLLAKKREILADIRKSMGDSLGEDVRLVFEIAQDNADRSVDELLKYIDAKVLGTKSETLDLIDAALVKLKEGSYGICEECGCEIPLKRLRILPFATHCVICQETVDRTRKEEALREIHQDTSGNSPAYFREDE
jgi:DnaK suppressor protein